MRFKIALVILITGSLYYYGSSLVNFDHNLRYIWSDAEGYFMYLPATFIYGTYEDIPVRTKFEYQPYPGTKKILTRFTYGVALMEAPFFLVAHLSRYVQGFPLDDPWANDYSVSILMAACFFTTLGLFYLYYYLSRLFENRFLALSVVAMTLLGTNLLYSCVSQPGISHHYTFFLVSAFLYYLHDYYQDAPTLKRTILLSALLGFIFLIRPTNAVLGFVFFLYGAQTRQQLAERWAFFKKNPWVLGVLILTGLVIAAPQMAYWYYIAGKLIMYSYGDWGGFPYWKEPKIWNVFFDLCNGVVPYTPIVTFAILGLLMTAWRNVLNGRLYLFVFLLVVYYCASWACWWFGGTYGYRSFIDFYPLLAVGFGYYMLQLARLSRPWLLYPNVAIFLLMTIVNLRMITYFYTFQVEADGRYSEQYWIALKQCLWLI